MHTRGIHPRDAEDSVRSPALPVVIRPAPLRLIDIEQRICGDGALAAQLAAHPGFCGVLARALFTRDRQARLRFADADSLALHLQGLAAG